MQEQELVTETKKSVHIENDQYWEVKSYMLKNNLTNFRETIKDLIKNGLHYKKMLERN
jgi:hypothetical protein